MTSYEPLGGEAIPNQQDFATKVIEAAEYFKTEITQQIMFSKNYANQLSEGGLVVLDNQFEFLLNPNEPNYGEDEFPTDFTVCYNPVDLSNLIKDDPRLYFSFTNGEFTELVYWEEEGNERGDTVRLFIGETGALRSEPIDYTQSAEVFQSAGSWGASDTHVPTFNRFWDGALLDGHGSEVSSKHRKKISFLIEKAYEDINQYTTRPTIKPEVVKQEDIEPIDDSQARNFSLTLGYMLDQDPSPVKVGARQYLDHEYGDTNEPIHANKGRTAIFRIDNQLIIIEETRLTEIESERSITIRTKSVSGYDIETIQTVRCSVGTASLRTSYEESLTVAKKHADLQPAPKTLSQTALLASLQESTGMFILTPARLSEVYELVEECTSKPACKIL